jgi:1,4-dihydroxy-6-naphthoate synthase
MKLTLGFSPCPNDTFIFDALVNRKIDTGDFEFEPVLADVQTLNELALEGRLDVTKLSFPAFFRSLDHYTLLNAGSAIGKGAGPLLISAKPEEISPEEINNATVLLPGTHTTANLLFSFAYPGATKKEYAIFSEIEDAVKEGRSDLGVIIHENRFTYEKKGLYKVADLGAVWEERTGLPIPLGGIAINQSVKRSAALKVDALIKASIDHAFKQYPDISSYVKGHAQAMDEDVMRQHIGLYVNEFTRDMGEEGRNAIENLQSIFLQINHMVPAEEEMLFL